MLRGRLRQNSCWEYKRMEEKFSVSMCVYGEDKSVFMMLQ